VIIAEKPPLAGVYLAHFGVKGMRWGTRKQEESTPKRRSKSAEDKKLDEAYKKIKPKSFTKKEDAAAHAESRRKAAAKLEPSESGSKKELSPEQRALLKKIAIGTTIAVGAAAAIYILKTRGSLKTSVDELQGMSGKKISANQYRYNVQHSISKSWGKSGYIKDSSFAREEFSLPAGHTFHRISLAPENSFGGKTYSTHSVADFNRYVTGFGGEGYQGNMHHVTFKAKEEIKVPTLSRSLETLREVMSREGSGEATLEQAHKYYNANSGGAWNSPRAAEFFNALRGKGYHAIVDEMDAGVRADSPLVVFAHDSFSSKSSSPISMSDFRRASSSLTEITDRKL
jgi:hypothetical protein